MSKVSLSQKPLTVCKKNQLKRIEEEKEKKRLGNLSFMTDYEVGEEIIFSDKLHYRLGKILKRNKASYSIGLYKYEQKSMLEQASGYQDVRYIWNRNEIDYTFIKRNNDAIYKKGSWSHTDKMFEEGIYTMDNQR